MLARMRGELVLLHSKLIQLAILGLMLDIIWGGGKGCAK